MGGIQSSPSAQTCSDKTLRTQTESLERKASACGFKEPCQREGQACRPGSCLLWVWETHTQRLQRPTPSCLRWVGGIKERKQRGTEITQRWGRKSDTKLWVVTPDFYSSPRRQKLLESQMWSGFSLMQQTDNGRNVASNGGVMVAVKRMQRLEVWSLNWHGGLFSKFWTRSGLMLDSKEGPVHHDVNRILNKTNINKKTTSHWNQSSI